MHYHRGDFSRFFNLIGNSFRHSTPQSWEGWVAGAAFMYGFIPLMGILPAEDTLQDISKESELIVCWGNDAITKSMYMGIDVARPLFFWKELGKKIILIEPYYNDTGAKYADKWIPIIPGTDAALAAAIAYVWITKGDYDIDYLDTHTIGFDEEHLPSGAPQGTSFKNYILGISDGIPKTPNWASEISGVASRVITELANEWSAKPTALFGMHTGACRRAYGHEFARILTTLQAMQGLGKPGVCMIGSFANLCGPYDKRQVGPLGYAEAALQSVAKVKYFKNSVEQIVCENIIDKIILNPPQKWHGGKVVNFSVDDLFEEHEYPLPGHSEIKMTWSRGSSGECYPDANNRSIRVYQSPKIETVVVQSPSFDRDCRLADIVLPVVSVFERQDITEPGKSGGWTPASIVNLRCAVFHQRCIEPVGESKSDYEICTLLAERMGLNDKFNEGNDEEAWLKKLYAVTNIPLSYDEFKKKGYYVWPFLEDYQPCKQLQRFYEEPEKNPLETPSGKIEIFSQILFNKYGAHNPEIPPVPHYIPEWEGKYSKSLVDKYPLQLLTPHPKMRYHGKYNDVGWLNEVYKVKGPDGYDYEPIIMNIHDANDRGVNNGDIAMVFNDRGRILCGVVTTHRILPGVARIAYGSWWDILEPKPGAINRGGDSNFLTTTRGMSEHHMGMAANSCLVEVEKADLVELSKKYPEGWAGKYRSWNKE